MDKKESIKIIEDFAEKLSGDFNVHSIIFFGSRASGKPNKDSDIDLIIVSDDFEGMNPLHRAAKMYDYWDALVAVDFLCFTIKEFNKLKNRISIVSEAVRNGILMK